MKALLIALTAVQAFALAGGLPDASAQTPDPVMVVVDTSSSMADKDSGKRRRKIDGAKLALLDFVGQIEPGTPVGLRRYPVPGSSDCNTGEQLKPVAPVNVTALSSEIRGLRPDGDTPTAETLRAAADELERSSSSGRGTLVLISDGEATCNDPCETAKELVGEGFDLETITVGFRISAAGREKLECIADALEGRYVDAQSGEDVSKAVADASQPGLEVEVADASLDTVADSPVRIEATISNGSETEARNASARIRLRGVDDGVGSREYLNPGVQRPVQRLGNIGPTVRSRTVTWTFKPGAGLLEGKSERRFEFFVVASADNAREPVQRKVVVTVTDATTKEDAGGVLKGRKLAIMGDSYSSGEGADEYLSGSRGGSNGCHRSPKTYLMEVFDIPDSHLLACSGAVVNDFEVPNEKNGVPAQREQLRRVMRDDIGAVALTISGNDIGFSGLAISCLVKRDLPCNEAVADNWLGEFIGQLTTPAAAYLSDVVGNDAYGVQLQAVLKGLNGNLNNEASFKARGGAAPILVLAYPIVVPLTGRSCGPMFGLLSPKEIDFIVKVETGLNAQVEKAVLRAHRDGVPVFFVATTETAFLPDHTVCDGDPYARALNSFNGVIPDRQAALLPEDFGVELARAAVRNPAPQAVVSSLALKYAVKVVSQGKQELLHPKRTGYQAMTRAILRWSRTPEAGRADDELKAVRPVPLLPTWTVSANMQLNANSVQGSAPTLQGGTGYKLSGSGFAPGAALTVVMQSTPQVVGTARADRRGDYTTVVGIPEAVRAGRHTLIVTGHDPGGRARAQRIPIEVEQDFEWTIPKALGVSAVLAFVAALLSFGLARIAAGPGQRPTGQPASS